MIFVSTGGKRQLASTQYAQELFLLGLKNIELSGGAFSDSFERDLQTISLYMNLRIHNYSPPPRDPFVFNLASTDCNIKRLSINHAKNSIILAAKFGANLYSFHAGFRIDPRVRELGTGFSKYSLIDRDIAIESFGEAVLGLAEFARYEGVKLLIENNVIGATNFKVYQEDPLLLTNSDEIKSFMPKMPANVGVLLDVAHLYVSSRTLGLDPILEHNEIASWVEAYHLSENNGLEDLNLPITENSWFWDCIKKDLNYYSLEIYGQKDIELPSQYNLAMKKIFKKNDPLL
jgi:sugar phosphate isomerase/epimerase